MVSNKNGPWADLKTVTFAEMNKEGVSKFTAMVLLALRHHVEKGLLKS